MNAKDIEAMDKWMFIRRLQVINEKTPDIEAIELIRGCNKYSMALPANLMPYVIKCCDAWEQTNKQQVRNTRTNKRKYSAIWDVRCRMKQGETQEEATKEVAKYSGYTFGSLNKLYTENKDARGEVDMLFPKGWDEDTEDS